MLFSGSNSPQACFKPKPKPPQCGPLPGTLLRIFIPPGAVVNLLNLIEVASPSGICLIIRLPFLGGGSSTAANLDSIINAVQSAGGTVEFA
ncbi:hypothetical protein [Desulfosporosinus sp.]|uniref:hypothetical protein n=1 Tax=Desulfosporosinus sp. TaxID=157907 RepID=UPI0025BFBE05|nr:hypothetical protein [Desulfosporosinus sp.]